MKAAPPGPSRPRIVALLVRVHRWLGIGLGGLVLAWFLSGFVMLWHGMPALDAQQRLASLPLLDLASARLSPTAALDAVGVDAHTLTVGMLGSRPVYRVQVRGRPITLFADTGKVLQGMSRAEALEVATWFLGDDLPPDKHDGVAELPDWRHRRLGEPDQWTLQSRALLPMHRFAFDDEAATVVYVSERTGEVTLVTDRASRRWGWLGPVVHWVYFTPIRRHPAIWLQGMIYASLAGILLTVTGLVWGSWVWLRRRRTPYRGWMRWHHVAGLLFGLVALAWILSGLLSLDPWRWHPGTAPTIEQRQAVQGGPLDLEEVTLDRLRAAAEALSAVEGPRELEGGRFNGESFVTARSAATPGRRLVAWLDAPSEAPAPARRRQELLAAAQAAVPGHRVLEVERLDHGDSYYYRGSYASADSRPLPVLRVRFDDAQGTALYLDPLTGALLQRQQRLTRINRWLYHGLHSWDHPALLKRPKTRLAWMIVLLCGGLTASASALVPGCRRLATAFNRGSRRTAGAVR